MQKRTKKILITILIIVVALVVVSFIRGAVLYGVIGGSHSSAWNGEGDNAQPAVMDEGGGGEGAGVMDYLITAFTIVERGWK